MRVVLKLKALEAPSFLMISLALFSFLFMGITEASNTHPTINIPRKLLQSSDENYEMKRLGTNCSKRDIEIHQEQMAPRPNGIPVYLTKITNMSVSGSSISSIHLRCGWFSSATLVNPKAFKRLQFDDCLVNDGHPIGPGASIIFYYSTTYLYPLSVSSVVCDHT